MIIILIGPAASGKSTWAKKYISEYPDFVIINADKLREMFFSFSESESNHYYERKDLRYTEEFIWKIIDVLVEATLFSGKKVILDNTNLDLRIVNNYKIYGTDIKYKIMDASLDNCIERASQRTRHVDPSVITKQYKKYLETIKQIDHELILK